MNGPEDRRMETIRTFVAADLPNSHRDPVARCIEKLRRTGADVKWAEPENLHLTLRFLGEIDAARVARADAALRAVAAASSAFEARLSGLGCFPNARAPRVIWLGFDAGREALTGLAGAVERELAQAGFPAADKPFAPHLTLGRVRGPRGLDALKALLEGPPGTFAAEPFRVGHVTLYRSTLTPAGPVYAVLGRYSLGG